MFNTFLAAENQMEIVLPDSLWNSMESIISKVSRGVFLRGEEISSHESKDKTLQFIELSVPSP